MDENKRIIHLKDFNLTLGFKGKLKWRGKKGRLEIIYNEARRSWYAHIPVEVEILAKAILKGSFLGQFEFSHTLAHLSSAEPSQRS